MALIVVGLLLAGGAAAHAKEVILLPNNPSLSPDGKTVAFDWDGDVWTVPVGGGVARQLTRHPARDRQPKFSPDGKEIAFTSDREGPAQVYVMPAEGGTPRQVTFHSAGFALQDWCPDGQGLLVQSARDNEWRHAERFFRVERDKRGREQMLFDDYGGSGSVSPDGMRLLFTREGPAWWRKGYHGSQAGQVWLYDREAKTFTRVLDHERGCLWPLWRPDGKGFYYVGAQSGSFNLREHDLATGDDSQLTHFDDDSVVFPCVARDGSAVVFRRLFDLYCYRPGSHDPPRKIDVWHDGDGATERKQRRLLTQATQVAFSHDGLEIAFIAGGDLWVMDTELREPRQITATPEDERQPLFSPDGESILFVSDQGGRPEVWKAQRADRDKYWWQNRSFKLERLTDDGEAKSGLSWGPDGTRIAYVRGRGDLWAAGADGKNARRLLESWSAPDYDWSPDGRWIAFARDDNDFNRDVWLTRSDGSSKPFNLSRHPHNESGPVWSPDGKAVAFVGHHASGTEAAVCFVWLREEDEKGVRDRSLEKALEKIDKVRKPAEKPKPGGGSGEAAGPGGKKPPPEVTIDFDRLPERVRRVRIPEGGVSGLIWSPDSTRLAFTATVEGKAGTYTLELGDDPRPKLLAAQTLSQARWIKQGNQIVGLGTGGVPMSLPAVPTAAPARGPAPADPALPRVGRGGAPPPEPGASDGGPGTAYRFQAPQEVDVAQKHAAAFDQCWRAMRDHFYDERLGNRDWDAVRRKYRDAAGHAPDTEGLVTVVQLMLGELNGSHLGFTPLGARNTPATTGWREETVHLGLRFLADSPGPGLKVRDVLPGGPASRKKTRILDGEVVLRIDGTPVDAMTDLTHVLNGPLARDVQLRVKDGQGKERDVTLRPITYVAARGLLYDKWLEDNRRAVDRASNGTLGYLHINAMSMPSFHKFEEELYSIGAGKDGLVIDVRENGGGSTTDHLLTALTQPVHAITVPRGGGPGYPQDRKVYATWNKPIVVLCNQNSFSNAEIFSHAIKTLKRGQLVGVPTAGGVISTGAVAIMDVGTLRMPSRGWFLVEDGKDMELNGAVPQHIVWPQPGELPAGKDAQLGKAVEVLLADVRAWKERPQPPLRKASEQR
jgi:tricorn protease